MYGQLRISTESEEKESQNPAHNDKLQSTKWKRKKYAIELWMSAYVADRAWFHSKLEQ